MFSSIQPRGDIKIELDADAAPKTVENFLNIRRSEISMTTRSYIRSSEITTFKLVAYDVRLKRKATRDRDCKRIGQRPQKRQGGRLPCTRGEDPQSATTAVHDQCQKQSPAWIAIMPRETASDTPSLEKSSKAWMSCLEDRHRSRPYKKAPLRMYPISRSSSRPFKRCRKRRRRRGELGPPAKAF